MAKLTPPGFAPAPVLPPPAASPRPDHHPGSPARPAPGVGANASARPTPRGQPPPAAKTPRARQCPAWPSGRKSARGSRGYRSPPASRRAAKNPAARQRCGVERCGPLDPAPSCARRRGARPVPARLAPAAGRSQNPQPSSAQQQAALHHHADHRCQKGAQQHQPHVFPPAAAGFFWRGRRGIFSGGVRQVFAL